MATSLRRRTAAATLESRANEVRTGNGLSETDSNPEQDVAANAHEDGRFLRLGAVAVQIRSPE
jgi:hypothetical protein